MDPGEFDHDVVVGSGQTGLISSQIAELLGFSQTTVYIIYCATVM